MVLLVRGRKALCDTRCNTFLRFILLCAYTDYYDHCDYYDDGNFFRNSPLLHSHVHDAVIMLHILIDTIVWLSSFLFAMTHTRKTQLHHTQTDTHGRQSETTIVHTKQHPVFHTFTNTKVYFLVCHSMLFILERCCRDCRLVLLTTEIDARLS